MNPAFAEPVKVRVVVPEITAPEGLTAIETSPLKLVTGFPETSWTVTVGWVVKSCLFTAPVATVVTASLVAVPNVSWISAGSVSETGSVIVAVRTFCPVPPTIESPGKVASPATADLVAVPEITASETLKTIEEVFPVMTLLS